MDKELCLLCLLLVLAALAACATTPTPMDEARFTSDQILFREAQTETTPVIVRRDTGIVGSPCAVGVYVDGSLAAHLRTGEAVALNIPGKEAIIGADPGALCAGGFVEAPTQLAGTPVYFRVARDTNAGFGIYRTTAR